MKTRLTLYDLTGKPVEVEHVSTVMTYENHISYTVDPPDREPFNVLVPFHRVHEVRFE